MCFEAVELQNFETASRHERPTVLRVGHEEIDEDKVLRQFGFESLETKKSKPAFNQVRDEVETFSLLFSDVPPSFFALNRVLRAGTLAQETERPEQFLSTEPARDPKTPADGFDFVSKQRRLQNSMPFRIWSCQALNSMSSTISNDFWAD